MRFPVFVLIGNLSLHPHPFFEGLAYLVAFGIYFVLRRRHPDPIAEDSRWWIVTAAIAGAVIGGKFLYLLEDPSATIAHRGDVEFLLGGKTIIGAIVGGWFAVEFAKRRLGIRARTGDLFALPLAIGVAVGRLGCFFSGMEDHTVGTRTALPWGIDFGDGPRHPTQLYEIIFLLLLATLIVWMSRRPHREGDLFRVFVAGYVGFRLGVDFLKPDVRVFGGLTSIQWACVLTLIYLVIERLRVSHRPLETATPPIASAAVREL